jgi:hypothetical protein
VTKTLFDLRIEDIFESDGTDRTAAQNEEIGEALILAWSGVTKNVPETDANALKFMDSLRKLPPTLDTWWDAPRNSLRVRSSSSVLTQLIRGTHWFDGMDEIVIVAIILSATSEES